MTGVSPEGYRSKHVVRLPAWKLQRLGAPYLQHEIDKLLREFGYFQMGVEAEHFGAPMITVHIEVSQEWS